MNILVAPRLCGAGGVETHLLYLCQLLSEHGAAMTVAARHAHPSTPLVLHQKELPIRLVTTPFAGELNKYRWSTLWALAVWPFQLRPRHFDVLLSFEPTRFLRFLSQFVKRDGFVLVNRVGVPVPPSETLDRKIVGLLDGFIVETAKQAAAAREAYGLGIPVAAIPHLGHPQHGPQSRHAESGKLLRVAFLGRYDRKKGVYRLLDIWPHLDIGPARLDFYGDGAERGRMLAVVRQLGLQGQVCIHGGWDGKSEFAEIMAQTDLVVLPSEEEGLPLVLLEAMGAGVPFVACDAGAVATLADGNPNVRVVVTERAALRRGIEDMAAALRTGSISSERLQRYYQRHYAYEVLSQRWVDALVHPRDTWRGGVKKAWVVL